MYCVKCEIALAADTKFCSSCGAKQEHNVYSVSPASKAGPTASAETYYTAIIGPKNQDRYLRQFAKFDQAGQAGASWHWPAFFVSFYWLLYRKMWGNAAIYFLTPYVLLGVVGIVAGVLGAGKGDGVAGTILGLGYLAYLIGLFVIVPMYADALYYKHCKKKIAAAIAASPDKQRQLGELSARGGTSLILLILLPIFFIFIAGILAAVSIPAYQSYIARSQISEAIYLADGLKVPVADFYRQKGICPGDNATASIGDAIPQADMISGKYVQSVRTNGDKPCTIMATMKSSGVAQTIAGGAIVLQLQDDAGALSWTCYSNNIKQAYLPKACTSNQ